MLVLETNGLTKHYGKKTVVDRVSMHVHQGDIYGFIGKNGAGKTTTMRMILGLALPNAGSVSLFGAPACDDARRRIGALVETPGLYKHCSAYETLRRYSILYGGTDAEIRDLLHLVGLDDAGPKHAGAFSLGMRQRLGIAVAMLGRPSLLILDEPVNGLDPAGMKEMRDLLLKVNRERGVTILISSHLLGELSKLATRYGIIREGVLTEEITTQALEEHCRQSIEIRCQTPAKAEALLRDRFGIAAVQQQDHLVIYHGLERAAELNAALSAAGCGVSDFHLVDADMEAYFLERIG